MSKAKHTQQEYIPYMEEWKKELSKLPKTLIIDIAANIGLSKIEHAIQVVDMCAEAAERCMKESDTYDPLLLGAILRIKDEL